MVSKVGPIALFLFGSLQVFQPCIVEAGLIPITGSPCEGGKAKLECPQDKPRIYVSEVKYGRNDKLVCKHSSGNPKLVENTNCKFSVLGQAKVRAMCNGKQRCEFPVTNEFIGVDPCPGTYKFVKLVYYCQS